MALLAVTAAAIVIVGGGEAEARSAWPWTRTVGLRLSPQQLGLSASTSARRLARAALFRSTRRLGLPGSLAGVRLRFDQRVAPGPGGGVELHNLRLRQTLAGRRAAPDGGLRLRREPHFNSEILSHAYYAFARQIGPDAAGFLLDQVVGQIPSAGTIVAPGTPVTISIGQRPTHPCP